MYEKEPSLSEYYAEPCPACGGQGQTMGTLGSLRWYVCVDCGMEYHS